MATGKPSNYILPIDIVEKLKCSFCQGYLSCGPIKMENNSYICGRCSALNKEDAILQPLFEIAMVQFIFPCMYEKEGCLQRMLFNRTQEHEDTCIFRTVPCPALTCTDIIAASKVYEHFGNNHSASIIEDNVIKLDLLESRNRNLLLYECDSIVVVKYCFSAATKVLQFSVAPLVEKGRRVDKYKLQIMSGIDTDNSINLSPKLCHKHDSSILLAGQYDEYNVDSYTSILSSPQFIFVKILLLFGDGDSVCERRGDDEVEPVEILDDEFESRTLDTITKQICGSCRYHKFLCKCSRPSYNSVQIDIPCPWKGCKKTSSKRQIIAHAETCEFKLHICPFLEDCEQGLYRMNSLFLSHLETHAQYCPNSNKVVISLFNENVHYNKVAVYEYFALLDHNVIRLTCSIEPNGKWNLTCKSFVIVKVNGYLTHEHCRLIRRLNQGVGKLVTYNLSDEVSGGECLDQFPRLKAVLNILKF